MDPLHLKPISREALMANLFSSAAFRGLFFLSVVVTVILIPITFWAVDNTKPYVFYVDESSILPNKAAGNDQMIVRWKIDYVRPCDGLVKREIFDPISQTIVAAYDPQPSYSNSLPLGPGYLNKTFLLPRSTLPGRYGYRARLEYWCNPLQRFWPIRYNTPELYFEVN